MKLKIMLLVLGAGVIGGTITALVMQSRSPPVKFGPPVSPLPAAISNYSKTFKLNPSPPIWAQPTNGNTTH
jgi:hypothetical protein